MERILDVLETTIPRGRTLRIRDGRSLDLAVVAGSLWVTQEDDTKDVVLEAGDRFRVTRNGATLAHAFREVRLRISYPGAAGVPCITLGGGYREVGASATRAMFAEWLQEIRGWMVAGARVGRNGFTFNTTFRTRTGS
jgi:hypothetical protein